MPWMKVRSIRCRNCGASFSARTHDRQIVRAPRKVRAALESTPQTCPKCGHVHEAGELLSSSDVEKLREARRVKRAVHCSECGCEGHNKRSCPSLRPRPAVIPDDDPDEEFDDFDCDDYYSDDEEDVDCMW